MVPTPLIIPPRDGLKNSRVSLTWALKNYEIKIFVNQKKLGVIPQDAKLTPWPNELLPQWKHLSAEEKKLYTRQVEVYAAYLAYTDHEIGRVIQAVDALGKLDDTLIIYVSGDNGSSPEGTLTGTPNEIASFNDITFSVPAQLNNFYDIWGSDKTYPHMATAWSWAFDTPFKWTKQVASHFGGTRQGMAESVVAAPHKRRSATHKERQRGFTKIKRCSPDVVPTILELTGILEPVMVNGVPQKSIEGVSMKYTFDKSAAHSPSRHRTQYFEIFGNRAIYHDGFIASSTPLNPPWELSLKPIRDPAFAFKWELYDVTKDWTQYDDMAASHPQKLREMQDLFWVEAARHQVLPLDASTASRFIAPRPNSTGGQTEFIYTSAISGIPTDSAPNILNKSYTITADIDVADNKAEGMLVTQGGRFGGFGLYLKAGRPVFVHNYVDLKRTRFAGDYALKRGRHTISFEFKL